MEGEGKLSAQIRVAVTEAVPVAQLPVDERLEHAANKEQVNMMSFGRDVVA